MSEPQFIQLYQHNATAVAQELLLGLSAPQAFTSPKYLYDALGSRLFEAITELPEYDLTRTEAQLMRLHSADMAKHLGTFINQRRSRQDISESSEFSSFGLDWVFRCNVTSDSGRT